MEPVIPPEDRIIKNDDLPPADKLMLARTRLISKAPFYGHLSMMVDWVASDMKWAPENCRTMGVRIKTDRRVELLWNPDFVASQTMHELIGAIEHELEHIVHLHMARRTKSRHPMTWNIAADMTVNGTKDKPLIGYLEDDQSCTLPLGGQLVFRPQGSEWAELTTEQLYEKIGSQIEKYKCKTCKGSGKVDNTAKTSPKTKGNPKSGPKGQQGQQGQGQQGQQGQGQQGQQGQEGQGQQGQEEQGQGQSGGHGQNHDHGQGHGHEISETGNETPCPDCSRYGPQFDDHSIWDESTVSADETRQVVQEMVREAKEKSRGIVPGHLVEAIENLNKAIVPWNHLLRYYLGRHNRGRRFTWSRANRRRDEFGNKGSSRHAVADAVVIIDVSGSIGTDELMTFFGEIEAMLTKVSVSVLQWDAKFQGWWPKYRKGDYKKIKINGRSGTDMAAPIEYLIKQRLIPRSGPVIMLTDGVCNWHAPCEFPMITVITTDNHGPGWGHTVNVRSKSV